MNLNMRILYFAYIFSTWSAAVIGERQQALEGSFHGSMGYDIFPSLLRCLISNQTEQKNETADHSAHRIIAQSCSNPYCVCTSPPAAPVVESFPDDYTITSAVFVYATSTGAADPCAYMWTIVNHATTPNINNDIDSIIDDCINPITNDHSNDTASNVPDYVRNLESMSFHSDES